MPSRLTIVCCVRYHVVQEFNKGVYDYIIATDESGAQTEADTDDEVEANEDPEPECMLVLAA